MFCKNCGVQVDDQAVVCVKCGVKLATFTPAGTMKTSGMAIASLVLGILGIPLLPIIFSIVALKSIRKQPGQLKGRGMAIAGLVLGIVLGGIIFIVFVFAIYSYSYGRSYFKAP